MRRIMFLFAFIAASANAQTSGARSSHLVVRHPNPSDLVTVALLGEDSIANLNKGLRLADASAPTCADHIPTLTASAKLPFPMVGVAKGTVSVPTGWISRKFNLPDAPIATGDWSQMQASLTVGKSAQRGELLPQAYVFYGSVEGYPDIRLIKGSKVTAVSECRVNVSSTRPTNVIRATVDSPDRGQRIYVLGYTQVGPDLWVSFYGSSANPKDEQLLTDILRSVAVSQ